MKIIAISDTHQKHRKIKIPDGDVFVFAGDMTNFNRSRQHYIDFNDWLGTLPHKYKLVISGNHDELFQKEPEQARSYMTNCTYLEDDEIIIDGVKFYGTPWQPWFYDWAFNLPKGSDYLTEKWAAIPNDTDVLITHCTPAIYKTLTYDLKWKQLGDLKVGEELLAFDEYTVFKTFGRCYRKSVVTGISLSKEVVWRIHLSNGDQLDATEDHLWLVTRYNFWSPTWITTKQLQPKDKYGINKCSKLRKVFDVWSIKTDWKAGYIAGIFDGEGFISPKWHFDMGFAQRPGVVLDMVKNCLEYNNLKVAIYNKTGGFSPKGDCLSANLRGTLPDKFRFLGEYRPQRLLEKFTIDNLNYRLTSFKDRTAVESIEKIGEREVAKVKTTTGTLFVEGYPMHNCPPHQICDVDMCGENLGCDKLANRVFEVQPKLHVFGHIHGSFGQRKKIGNTLFYNVSHDHNKNIGYIIDLKDGKAVPIW